MGTEPLKIEIVWESPTFKSLDPYQFSTSIASTPDNRLQVIERLFAKASAICRETGVKQRVVIQIARSPKPRKET